MVAAVCVSTVKGFSASPMTVPGVVLASTGAKMLPQILSVRPGSRVEGIIT